MNYSAQNRRAEVGYLLDRRYRGKGLMSEALRSVIEFAFNDLGLHRLEADTDVENIASLALLEKIGFQLKGCFRERWHVNKRWQDSAMLGLLQSEWDRPSHSN